MNEFGILIYAYINLHFSFWAFSSLIITFDVIVYNSIPFDIHIAENEG